METTSSDDVHNAMSLTHVPDKDAHRWMQDFANVILRCQSKMHTKLQQSKMQDKDGTLTEQGKLLVQQQRTPVETTYEYEVDAKMLREFAFRVQAIQDRAMSLQFGKRLFVDACVMFPQRVPWALDVFKSETKDDDDDDVRNEVSRDSSLLDQYTGFVIGQNRRSLAKDHWHIVLPDCHMLDSKGMIKRVLVALVSKQRPAPSKSSVTDVLSTSAPATTTTATTTSAATTADDSTLAVDVHLTLAKCASRTWNKGKFATFVARMFDKDKTASSTRTARPRTRVVRTLRTLRIYFHDAANVMDNDPVPHTKHLRTVLQTVGEHLTTLDVSGMKGESVIHIAMKLCPHLHHLRVSRSTARMSSHALQMLLPRFHHLKSLVIDTGVPEPFHWVPDLIRWAPSVAFISLMGNMKGFTNTAVLRELQQRIETVPELTSLQLNTVNDSMLHDNDLLPYWFAV